MSAQDSNKVSVAEGWARFSRKVRPSSRWAKPDVPEYDPNWIVTFHVCGKSWTKTAVGCPVAMGPKPVTAWCKEEIRTQAWMIQSGNIQEAQARRAPASGRCRTQRRRVLQRAPPPRLLLSPGARGSRPSSRAACSRSRV